MVASRVVVPCPAWKRAMARTAASPAMASAPPPPWTCRSTKPGTTQRSAGAAARGAISAIVAPKVSRPVRQPSGVRMRPSRWRVLMRSARCDRVFVASGRALDQAALRATLHLCCGSRAPLMPETQAQHGPPTERPVPAEDRNAAPESGHAVRRHRQQPGARPAHGQPRHPAQRRSPSRHGPLAASPLGRLPARVQGAPPGGDAARRLHPAVLPRRGGGARRRAPALRPLPAGRLRGLRHRLDAGHRPRGPAARGRARLAAAPRAGRFPEPTPGQLRRAARRACRMAPS